MGTEKVFLKKSDIILIAAASVICILLFLPRLLSDGSDATAVIYKDGVKVQSVRLNKVSESYEIDLKSDPEAVLAVEKGRICYKSADCHDKLCVKAGWLSKPGDTAACLPSKTLVVIEGSSGGGDAPDIISY